MKQNSSIMFHDRFKQLENRHLLDLKLAIFAVACGILVAFSIVSTHAGEKPPEYLNSFDPAKGFKPAQADLTEIFLQIAGSLEYYGSPVPYLRHMKTEHARIEAKYRQRFGTAPKSYLPAYMTDAYLDKLVANWAVLAPKLGLEALSKSTGNLMRDAINGTRGNGTIIVEIFNRHQERIHASMIGKANGSADFDALQAELVKRLHFNESTIHDSNFSMAERDAVDFSLGAREEFVRLFAKLDAGLKPADAERIKNFVLAVCIDTGRMAQSELQAGIIETALDRETSVKSTSVR